VRSLPPGATLVEVGVWTGRSMCSVSDLIRSKRLRVIAVDTFLGVVNQAAGYGAGPKDRQMQEFLRSMATFRIEPEVFVGTSKQAAARGIEADLVLIDADHEYPSVKEDIDVWWPRTRQILCGHDYDIAGLDHPGVNKAVDEAFPSGLTVEGSVWSVRRDVGIYGF
jgi:hypothetical protein